MEVNNTLDFMSRFYEAKTYKVEDPDLYIYNRRKRTEANIDLPGPSVLPVNGTVTSRFGWRETFKRMHHGIDVSLRTGDTIRAAMAGRVERVDMDPRGYGLFVVIRHNEGVQTLYGHLSKALAMTGAFVDAGHPVALGGNTGNSTGPHLHFEIRKDGEPIDPALFFDFNLPEGMTRMRSLSDLDGRNPRYRNNQEDREDYQPSRTSSMDNVTQPETAVLTSAVASQKYSGRNTYVVRHGDTLGTVSRRLGIPVLSLCRLNGLNSDSKLKPGTMIRIR